MVNPFTASGQRRVISPEEQATGLAEETLNEMLRRRLGQAKETGREVLSSARQATEKAGQSLEKNVPRGVLFPRASLLTGAVLPGLSTALTEMEEGRTAGAVAAPVGSLFGAGVAGGVARGVLGGLAKTGPAPVRLLAQGAMAAAPFLGGMIGAPAAADVAEKVKRGITKEPTAGKEEELGSRLAAAEKIAALQQQVNTNAMNAETQNMIALGKAFADQQYLNDQRNMPMINKMKDADLVRQQTLLNTLSNQYARLGTLATAGKLATGAQAETGATLRTALTSNPYAGSVLQAPSISFG